jgi:hypothetical protein
MTQQAEEFMDHWLQANIASKPIHPRATVSGFARKCRAEARRSGIALDDILAVVGDLEEAITDELRLKGVAA